MEVVKFLLKMMRERNFLPCDSTTSEAEEEVNKCHNMLENMDVEHLKLE